MTIRILNAADVSVPAAVTVFPGELYQAPRSWTELGYHNLIYFHEAENAATSQPGSSRSSTPANSEEGFRQLRSAH
jgi:hypothetical protein